MASHPGVTRGAFTGAWLRGAYTDPDQATQHTADPAHAVTDAADQNPTWQGPPVEAGPSALEIGLPGSEWVVQSQGRVLDTSDTRAHTPDPGDHGASRERYFGEPPTQFTNEKYEGNRFESFPVETPFPVAALQRGLNGLPTNNPDGYRAGWVEQSWITRKFVIGERIHDHRVLLPNIAFAETEADGSTVPPASPYLSPFAPLARMIRRVNQRPTMRRQPPEMLADQTTDGSPMLPPPVDIWVVG